MSEEQKQTQQPDERGEDKKKKRYLLYALACSMVAAVIFMGAATAVDPEWLSYVLNTVSSAGYVSAAVCLTWLVCFGGIKNIGWKKQIVKALAAGIYFLGAVLVSVVSWGNLLNSDLSPVVFWLVAITFALFSIEIIGKQISLGKQDFDEKPVTSYLFVLCGMIYAFAYAVALQFEFDIALKIFYTLHTIVALTVFINIIFKFGIKTDNFAQLALFIVSVITLMALLVSTLYFWFWDAYAPDIFASIMGVFAGLLGGVLTLTGVAWTIKRQEETRREDIAKREEERKQEEIAKAKPFIAPVYVDDPNNISCDSGFTLNINENQKGEIKLLAVIENSDNANFSIKAFWYDGKWIVSDLNNYVLKNKKIQIMAFVNKWSEQWEKPNVCYLKVADVLSNIYYFRLIYDFDVKKKVIYLRDIQEITKEEAPDDNN